MAKRYALHYRERKEDGMYSKIVRTRRFRAWDAALRWVIAQGEAIQYKKIVEEDK